MGASMRSDQRILKYPLKITDDQKVEMPGRSKVLHVGLDPGGSLCVWAAVSPGSTRRETHLFAIVGTRNPPGPDIGEYKHLGSVLHGTFVWHVFHRRA